MIRIGNQTACWAATPVEPFSYAVASGFDAFEWFPDKKPGAGWDGSDLDEGRRQELRDAARAAGLRVSVHARWQANPLQPASGPLFREDLDLARDLGAALINIHLYLEEGIPGYVRAILPMIQATAQAEMLLSIENTPDHCPRDFNELFLRLHESGSLESSHVGMCFDMGHANLCSATRNNYLAFLDQIDSEVPIIHVHLHENWGDADTHLPLFTGPAGRDDSGVRALLARLARRGFSGSMILEQWPHPPSLLNQARDRLRQLLPPDGTRPLREPIRSLSPEPHSVRASATPVDGRPDLGGAPLESRSSAVAPQRHLPSKMSEAEKAFSQSLVAADQRSRSWREKLDSVRALLSGNDSPITAEELADVAIYLRFIGTGEIRCTEDGRHFRPDHHARIGSEIRERLAKLASPENAIVLRKIYPWLPSSKQTFRHAEPLTRIRDIAHRNDIPSELKREIKESLQNKLHRCAGPEDLATSSALLKRVTAPGAGYSREFVEQFRIFHEELKEFFSAQSLDEYLRALLPSLGAKPAELVRLFQSQKALTTLPGRLAALQTLTQLRQEAGRVLADRAASEAQELMLADIGLEDFGFVLVSDLVNQWQAAKPGAPPSLLRDALVLTVQNLALSSIEPEECQALEPEIQAAWPGAADSLDREPLLRWKAAVDRTRRLAETYADRIAALFTRRVEPLGRALGVAEHAIQVFSEGDIRRHLVFQLSKLAGILLRRVREQLSLPAWDVLVSGQATGRVQSLDALGEFNLETAEPVLLLLKHASGDEEIPRAVAGIVLAHEIPHLSHLGVRARQAGVVFVASDQLEEFQKLADLTGKQMCLVATPEKVEWKHALQSDRAPKEHGGRLVSVPKVKLVLDKSWVPLEEASAGIGGGKAAGARVLAALARQAGAGFNTPRSLVVPFGVMESVLRADPTLEAHYFNMLNRIDQVRPEDLAPAAEELCAWIRQLPVPAAIATEVTNRFGRTSSLIVRSSANLEDQEDMAGAGLFQSVPNVPASEVNSAIRLVWASLWNPRATLARQEAHLSPTQAHMAVLIQEMLAPDFSFVLHTVNPINHHRGEVYAEIVVGHGETLVSGSSPGSPYRWLCEKEGGRVTTLAFANLSRALWAQPGGGLTPKTVDYSRIDLTSQPQARAKLGRRLAAIGRLVENALGMPQDIEGSLLGEQIYLVQARPQQGLPAPGPR